MLTFWLRVLWEALEHCFQTIGKEPSDVVVSIVIFLIIGLLLVRRKGWPKGWEEVKERIPRVLGEDFVIVLCVFILILGFHMARDSYREWRHAEDRAHQVEQEKQSISTELAREKDHSQPKFEIVTAAATIGEGNLQENGKRTYFGDTYLQVAVLNHGAPSVIKECKEFVRLTNGTELEGHLLMGNEKNIHMYANGPRGQVELPIYPSLISVWSVTPIPTGGRGVGSVIFAFPRGTKTQAEGLGGAIVLKLWDVSGREYDAEVPWQVHPPHQEIYMLPGMGRN